MDRKQEGEGFATAETHRQTPVLLRGSTTKDVEIERSLWVADPLTEFDSPVTVRANNNKKKKKKKKKKDKDPTATPTSMPTASSQPSLSPAPSLGPSDGPSLSPSSGPSVSFVPTVSSAPSTSPTKTPKHGPMRLKLYWRKGYKWQGEDKEEKYCMDKSGDGVEIDKCGGSGQKWIVYGRTIRPDRDRGDCLTAVGSSYSNLRISKCNGSTRQDWVGFDLITFPDKGKPFELSPFNKQSQCVTQHHHPRKGEDLYMRSCKEARKHSTSQWNRY